MDYASKASFGAQEVFPTHERFKENDYYWKIDENLHTVAEKYG